jgi:hypothetical protein
LPRANEHRFAIRVVALAVKMCVGVDQQSRLVCRVGIVGGDKI